MQSSSRYTPAGNPSPAPLTPAFAAGDAGCATPGCGGPVRLRLNGKPACTGHVPELVRAAAAEARVQAAKAALLPRTVLPVGTILLRSESITDRQLAEALRAQAAAGSGRLGAWLRQQAGLGEDALTAALAAQQRCPALAPGRFDPAAATALPRPLVERFGAVPFSIAEGELVFAFEDRAEPGLLGAARRVHGRDARAGVLPASAFWHAMRASLAVRLPAAMECEAGSLDQLARSLGDALLEAGARAASLAAVRDVVWLRFTPADAAAPRDLVCTLEAVS